MSKGDIQDDVIIRLVDIERDAQDIAAMWRASELQWPSGLNRGIPATREMVIEWEEEERLLATYVAEVDGKVVGYCSYLEQEDKHAGEAYLSLLNVHPGYQGRSVGRKLVQATIERSVAEGFQYQTLHTWSANFKAVPAYKKTGHFWAPDSSVLMENYVPGALQLSVARPFFEKHDWYRCFERDLLHDWDDELWHGIQVYTYRWRADGETLVLRYDRHARSLVSVENGDIELSAVVDDTKPLAGTTCRMKWHALNKASVAKSFSLAVTGEKGLDVDHIEQFVLEPGESRTIETAIKIADDAPAATERGTWPAVLTRWLVDNQCVEMKTGVEPQKPVSLSIYPETLSLRPGETASVSINLHSKLDESTELMIRSSCEAGLVADWRERLIIVPVRGHVSLPINLCAGAEGVFSLDVHVVGSSLTQDESFKVFSVAAGGMVFDQEAKDVRVETDHVRFKFDARQGRVIAESKPDGVQLVSCQFTAAPPYSPSEFKNMALKVAWRGPRVVVFMQGKASHRKGLVLHAEVVLAATGLGSISAKLVNQGDRTHETSLCLIATMGDRSKLRMVHPGRRAGILAPAEHYPAGSTDELRDPSDYAEPWVVWDRHDSVAGDVAGGVAWDDSLQRITSEWNLHLTSRDYRLEAGETTRPVGYAFCGVCGLWENAAGLLRDWKGIRSDVIFGPAVQMLPAKHPLLTVDDSVMTELQIYSASQHNMDGRLCLTADAGVGVEPSMFDLEGVMRGNEQTFEYAIDLAGWTQGVYGVSSHLKLPTETHEKSLQVVRAGTRHVVSVERTDSDGQQLWTIDNGSSRMMVAPGFGPSIISWKHDQLEMLSSPFPQVEGFGWVYPFFGGISLSLVPDGRGKANCFPREKVNATSLQTEWNGLVWKGIRLSCLPEHEDLKGLRMEADLMVVGESSLLRVVYRLCNTLETTSQTVHIGTMAQFSLGDDAGALVGRTDDVTRWPTQQAATIAGQPWAMVTRPATGAAAIVVSSANDAVLYDCGQNGRLLGFERSVQLKGKETAEFTSFFVLASDTQDALRYRVLRDIGTVS